MAVDYGFNATNFQPLTDLQATNWMTAGAAALFVYDWLLCLDLEIAYVWPARWSTGKILYYLQRGLTLWVTVMCLAVLVITNDTPAMCRLTDRMEVYLTIALIATVQTTLLVRVYAMYRRSKWVFAFLAVLFFLCLGATLGVYQIVYKRIVYYPNPLQGVIDVCNRGCDDCEGPIINIYTPTLLFDTTIASMTAYQAYLSRSERYMAPTLALLYRDGLLYYGVICAAVLANVLALSFGRSSLRSCLIPFMRTLMSAMTSRLLFNLHQGLRTQQEGTGMMYGPSGFISMRVDEPSNGSVDASRGSKDLVELGEVRRGADGVARSSVCRKRSGTIVDEFEGAAARVVEIEPVSETSSIR